MPGNATTRQMLRLMADAVKASDAGDHDAAERTWWQCFALDDGHDTMVLGDPTLPPLRLRPYMSYADYLRTRGRVNTAIEILDSAHLRWPADPDLYLLLGRCHEARKDWAQVAAAYERSIALRPDPGLCLFLARAMDRLRRRADALRWLHHSLVIDPDYEESHYNLGCVHEKAGELDAAVAHLRRATELDADYTLAHARLGQLLYRRALREHAGDPAHATWIGARAHLTRAAALDPDDGWSQLYLGMVCEHEARLADAEPHYQAATRLLPEAGIAWSTYGTFLSRHGDRDHGERLLRHAVALDPDDPDVRFWLGVHLWRRARCADARTELRQAHRLGHRRARAWLAERDGERRRRP